MKAKKLDFKNIKKDIGRIKTGQELWLESPTGTHSIIKVSKDQYMYVYNRKIYNDLMTYDTLRLTIKANEEGAK